LSYVSRQTDKQTETLTYSSQDCVLLPTAGRNRGLIRNRHKVLNFIYSHNTVLSGAGKQATVIQYIVMLIRKWLNGTEFAFWP